MSGLFITFEGNEGSGKSTQIPLLAERLRAQGRTVRTTREPGGTPIGEEIRHTLKHSAQNQSMDAKTELLLMNASRAQLVTEIIRPSLAAGEIVLCDRFFDSTIAYQGFGRQLDLSEIRSIVDFAVGNTTPDLTFLLLVPHAISEQRRLSRQSTLPQTRDRIEEAGEAFFDRVARGYQAIAASNPQRIRTIEAARSIELIHEEIYQIVEAKLKNRGLH